MRKITFLFLFLCCACYSHLACAKQFQDFSYSDLNRLFQELEGPFASIQTADKLWGHKDLRSATCSAQVVRITTVERLQAAPPSPPEFLHSLPSLDKPLPQVVISGEIHGNERVGPSSSLFTSQLLVWAGLCAIKHSDTHCKHLKQRLQLSDEDITWLAFLATKRDTFVLPTANCQGYARNTRTDEGVDTNRDFSYARQDKMCFVSTTAKIFQALFSTVSVQILVTFHGGMVALGYEWGSMDHPRGKDFCPDHRAHKDIADSMARFGGTFRRAKAYRAKPINSIVYPVYGGMEDWAYAAGWDTARVRADCRGYAQLPVTKAALPDETQKVAIPNNRAVTFLVETSDRKGPSGAELGSDQYILRNEEASNERHGGHVPRNTRLALAAIDMVEPYVCISAVGAANTSDSGSDELVVRWYVGGAHEVDRTWLSWHRADPSVLTDSDQTAVEGAVVASSVLRGKAKWGLADPLKRSSEGEEGLFVSTVLPPPASMLGGGLGSRGSGSGKWKEVLWLVVHAVVDQKWAPAGQGHPKELHPQSHLVQLRTNASYRASSYSAFDPGDVRLSGRPGNEWLSDGIEVEVGRDSGDGERMLRGKGKWGKGRRRSKSKLRGGRGGEVNVEMGGGLRVRSLVEHCAWWTRGRPQ